MRLLWDPRVLLFILKSHRMSSKWLHNDLLLCTAGNVCSHAETFSEPNCVAINIQAIAVAYSWPNEITNAESEQVASNSANNQKTFGNSNDVATDEDSLSYAYTETVTNTNRQFTHWGPNNVISFKIPFTDTVKCTNKATNSFPNTFSSNGIAFHVITHELADAANYNVTHSSNPFDF